MYNQKYHKFHKFYNHKYGFHINGPNQAAYEAAIRLKPRVIKTLDHDVGAMKKIRQAVPDAFFIGRLFDPVQDFGNDPHCDSIAERVRRARQRGAAFAEKILRLEVNKVHLNGRPVFDAWESFNEVFPESVDADTQKVYDEFQVAFGQKMLAAGFEPIAMNFATGNFRGWHFVENFAGTLDTYKYLGFHEYDWPRLDRLHNLGLNSIEVAENIRDRLPGVGANRGNDGMWLCLRYRRIMHEGPRQKYGDKHTCIITECGMTQGVQQGDDVGPWFRTNTLPRHSPHAALPGLIDEDEYWQQLLWYNRELMQDDYVMGACLFVTGAVDKWWSFEHLGPIVERLAAFQQEIELADSPGQVDPALPSAIPSPGDAAAAQASSSPSLQPEPLASGEDPAPPEIIAADPAPEEVQATVHWSYTLISGSGLPLLVGDIGLPGQVITVVRPNGVREVLVGGSKPEHGPGGFEIYAFMAGTYEISFLDQKFQLRLSGRFTRVIFSPVVSPDKLQVRLHLREDRATYPANEPVFIEIEVISHDSEPVPFTVMGLLTSTGHFKTCRENGLFPAGDSFKHQDSITFSSPGAYIVQLSICFAPRPVCLNSDTGWKRFDPALTVFVQ